MIDPDTGWFNMAQISNKTATEIADITEKTWFTHYPLSHKTVFNRGTKFMTEFSRCVKMTMASKGNLLQLGILSPMQSSNESIKILEIASARLTCLTSLTTIHGQAS